MSVRPLIIVGVVLAMAAAPVSAGQLPNNADVWQDYARRLSTNAYVRVRVADGSSVKGHVVLAGPDAIRINPRTRVAVPPREIPYDRIVAIDPQKEPRWNPAVKVLIGVGIAVGVSMLLSVLAIAAGD